MVLGRTVLVNCSPSDGSSLPMGILTLAAVAAEVGYETEIVDLPSRADESYFLDWVADAAIVGFSTVCNSYPRVLFLAESIKARNRSTLVIFGGPQATTTARPTIQRFPAVDLIIRGEAEVAWPALLQEAEKGSRDWSRVPGACYRQGTQILDVEAAPLIMDLDEIPIPLFEKYSPMANLGTAMVEVGRGCPYGCTFCSTNTFFKRRFRMKSPSRIIAELDSVHQRYGLRHFDFVHDMFTVRLDTVEAICEALRDRPYQWNCSCRTDRVNPQLLTTMYASGCRGLYFGLETGSQKLQRSVKKNLNLSDAVRTIRLAQHMGFNLTTSIIVGYPQETVSDLRDSILLALELMSEFGTQGKGLPPIVVQVHLFAPLADTPLANEGWRFDFDGIASNTVSTDGRIPPWEAALIRDHFDLFSAFYHPVETPYSREDYLALTTLLDRLPHYPAARRFVLEWDRLGFLDFLTRGRFGLDLATRTPSEIAERMLELYASSSPNGSTMLEILELERLMKEARQWSPGAFARCIVTPLAAKFVPGLEPAANSNSPHLQSIVIYKTPHRLEIEVEGAPAASLEWSNRPQPVFEGSLSCPSN